MFPVKGLSVFNQGAKEDVLVGNTIVKAVLGYHAFPQLAKGNNY